MEQQTKEEVIKPTDVDNPNLNRSLPKMTEKEQLYYRKYGIVRYIRRRIVSNKNMLIMMTGQTGCHPLGTTILMANGEWKNIEDIKVGDTVLSPQKDGSNIFSKVKWINKWFCKYTYDIYKLNKNKELLYSCSNNHFIPVYHNFKERVTENDKRKITKKWWDFKEYQAQELFGLSKEMMNHQNIGFSSFPIEKYNNQKNCDIEPYTLGVFLGNGMFYHKFTRDRWKTQLSITDSVKEVIDVISKTYTEPHINNKKGTECKTFSWSNNSLLAYHLEMYGLKGTNSGTKFIPKQALLSDIEYRKKLLAGLIDTDGYYKGGGYEFTLKSKKLIEDIRDLVYSLGGRTGHIRKVKKKITKRNFEGTYYRMTFYIRDLDLPIIKKHKKGEKDIDYNSLNSNRIAIQLKKAKPQMVYGFELDSDSHWYITDNWMITKNSGKSWTAGSIAEMLNEDFNVSRLVFKGRDLMKLINLGSYELRKGVVIVWDEAGIDLSNRNWYSITNKLLSFLLQTFRHKNFILIFTVPYEDFVDSATKKLFHAQFECVGINRSNNTVAVKPKFLQYNAEKKKWYRKYLKVSKAGNKKKTKIKRWNVPKPSDEFIKAYEEKKNYFTKLLNNEIEVSLNKLEGNGFEEKKPLTELQTKVLTLYKMGITRGKHILQVLDMDKAQASRIKGSLFQKGYSSDNYPEDKNINEEYIEQNKDIIKSKLKDLMDSKPSEPIEIQV